TISKRDWSSDVCSSDLLLWTPRRAIHVVGLACSISLVRTASRHRLVHAILAHRIARIRSCPPLWSGENWRSAQTNLHPLPETNHPGFVGHHWPTVHASSNGSIYRALRC